MNYYLDQEFHEGFRKPFSWLPTIGSFNKPYHFIELISIGLVAEDGREYYAISKDFNLKSAMRNKWLKENVLNPIAADFYRKESGYAKYHHSGSLILKNFLKWYGKSNKQIRQDIIEFVCSYEQASEYAGVGSLDSGFESYLEVHPPVFYGYYADYDWVLFCSLFGTMMDLPKGFPMHCLDLKQMLDEAFVLDKQAIEWLKAELEVNEKCPPLNVIRDIFHLENIESHASYPKQENEHHALADAHWNMRLHQFIKSL